MSTPKDPRLTDQTCAVSDLQLAFAAKNTEADADHDDDRRVIDDSGSHERRRQ